MARIVLEIKMMKNKLFNILNFIVQLFVKSNISIIKNQLLQAYYFLLLLTKNCIHRKRVT